MLVENLAISFGMTGAMLVVHFLGLAGLIAGLRASFAQRWRNGSALRRGIIILLTVFGLVLLHGVQVGCYAALYRGLGVFADWETSIYFAATTFTTLGFGDVLIDDHRRIIPAIEAFTGFLLIGWSTAFLVSVTAKMGLLEAQLEAVQRERHQHDREAA